MFRERENQAKSFLQRFIQFKALHSKSCLTYIYEHDHLNRDDLIMYLLVMGVPVGTNTYLLKQLPKQFKLNKTHKVIGHEHQVKQELFPFKRFCPFSGEVQS